MRVMLVDDDLATAEVPSTKDLFLLARHAPKE